MDGGFFFIVCKIKLEPRDTSDQIVQFFAFGLNITFLVFRGTIFYREIIVFGEVHPCQNLRQTPNRFLSRLKRDKYSCTYVY